MKDKEFCGLWNFFNYCEDDEIDYVAGYSIDKWRRFVKIRKSGVFEVYVNDNEIREAYEAFPVPPIHPGTCTMYLQEHSSP